MASKFRERLTFANVASSIALFAALSTGGAYAADKITSKDIAKKAVKSKHIKNGQVKGKDVAAEAIDSSKIADGVLLGKDFAEGQLPQGPAGPKGDTGATGPKGTKGDKGPIGPTEGTSRDWYSSGGFSLTKAFSWDSSPFTTTRAGRLLVIKPLSQFSVNCATDGKARVWLEVDGVAVPGSVSEAIPTNTPVFGLVLSGVTGSLAAGEHTAKLVGDCSPGTYTSHGGWGTGGVTAVVLGD